LSCLPACPSYNFGGATIEKTKMPKPNVREKIVEAALELFHTRGFNGCGVLDITDAAGVPKGSFYNHFKSKELLALAVLALYLKRIRFEMLHDKRKPPLQRLRSHFKVFDDAHVGWRFARGCLMGNFASEISDQCPAIRQALKNAFNGWCDTIAAVLREARAQGEIAARHDPDRLARFLVNSWEGALVRSKVTRTRAPFEDFFAISFDSLLKK
jgi:TetR/AcrR family transcriptional regulator, transcriptional repressor for nem operon